MSDVERQKFLQIATRKLVCLTLLSVAVLVVIFYFIDLSAGNRTYLVSYVFIAGVIGGFVSIQQRLPQFDLNQLKELSASWFSMLLMPLNGGIFALVLMLTFIGGLVEGALFPRYVHPPIDHENLIKTFAVWLDTAFPKEGADVAKLLFWSFVSGFSERFVPQIIRRTESDANSGGDGKSGDAA